MSDNKSNSTNLGLWAAFGAQRSLLGFVLVFGVFVNLLVLTGPIFALQVYDRVLSSRSEETLVALVILMGFLFLVMGILDHTRKRIAARIGERIVSRIEEQIFDSALARKSLPGQSRTQAFSDLETLRQFFASPVFIALLDLPWFPIFIFGIWLFHPALGWLSAIGALILFLPGVWNLLLRGSGLPHDTKEYQKAQEWAQIALTDPDVTHGIHLKDTVFPKWRTYRDIARTKALKMQDSRTKLVSISQTLRMFLQSAIIAMAAYLVIQGQLTAGAIIAATVLLSRALGPLDLIGQNTQALKSQFGAWRRLSTILTETPIVDRSTYPPLSGANILIDQVTIFPPGARRAAIRMVNFDLRPGQAVGVIGPTAAGKSTLTKAIIGHWPVAGGQIRIGGMPIDQANPEELSDYIGYLPQQLTFLSGTIAQNISRFQTGANAAMLTATRNAGAHEMIISLAAGYETKLGPEVSLLPGGLIQRIGLARAIFGDPKILIFDEPSNNLDTDGMQMLQELIFSATATGKSVVICTQRPAAITNCDLVLVLDAGTQKAFGTAQQILNTPKLPKQNAYAGRSYGGRS